MGVYRAAFATIEQTTPLATRKVGVPVVALGGDEGQGERVRQMVERVAERVSGGTVPGCGHFIPEECPEAVVRQALALAGAGLPTHHSTD